MLSWEGQLEKNEKLESFKLEGLNLRMTFYND